MEPKSSARPAQWRDVPLRPDRSLRSRLRQPGKRQLRRRSANGATRRDSTASLLSLSLRASDSPGTPWAKAVWQSAVERASSSTALRRQSHRLGQITNPPTISIPPHLLLRILRRYSGQCELGIAGAHRQHHLARGQGTGAEHLQLQPECATPVRPRDLGRGLIRRGFTGAARDHSAAHTSARSDRASDFLNIHPENRDPTTTGSPLPPNFLRPYQGF